MKHAISRIHFVGIGGAGMCGIAEVLHNLGYLVSGSDQSVGPALTHLQSLGIRTHVGHASNQVANAQVVVTSTAVSADNPEVLAARHLGVPVVPRAVMLAELMRLKQGIAIAGTHGKTTTTSITATVLAQAGLDPTFVIGGKLNSAGTNARLGEGAHIVVEADESDASFLNLLPVIAAVTNIDEDHMDTYGHDQNRLHQAFTDFLHKMPFYGHAVLCADDEGVRTILPRIERPITTYGLLETAMVRAVNVRAVGPRMQFDVLRPERAALAVDLNLAGVHNVCNALAAIAIATQLQVSDTDIASALGQFNGVGRRFQLAGQARLPAGGHATVIDDYGHHPVEMRATLAAARGAYPGRRLVLVFQPHRYTRTRDCFDDFVQVMGLSDLVLLTEVYAAGELPIVAADSRALARSLRIASRIDPILVPRVDDLPASILNIAQDGDVVLCMGAGSIGHVAQATVALGHAQMEDAS